MTFQRPRFATVDGTTTPPPSAAPLLFKEGKRLVELRAGELHELRVLGVLGAHLRVELRGCARAHADAEAEADHLLVDPGVGHRGEDAGVELLDRLARGAR